MIKPVGTDDLSAIPLCVRLLDSEVVQLLRVTKPRAIWWIVPAVMLASGIAGWIATLPLG